MKIPTVFSSSQPPETSPSNKSIRSTHSTKSSRSIARSVRTMKTLLPLTLSPCVPASPLSESQQAQRLAANDEEEERVGTYRRHRRSPRSRRDIPLFDVPANFPFPERTYSSPTHNGKNCLSMPAPPRQPIIVNDYELSDSDEVEATPPRHTIVSAFQYSLSTDTNIVRISAETFIDHRGGVASFALMRSNMSCLLRLPRRSRRFLKRMTRHG